MIMVMNGPTFFLPGTFVEKREKENKTSKLTTNFVDLIKKGTIYCVCVSTVYPFRDRIDFNIKFNELRYPKHKMHVSRTAKFV